MSYQVLARKYRPKSFDEMVGQEHVLRALINALNSDRVHHAYLFTGTRGVGKTTLARLLAKCLNCEQGVSAAPCETCVACQEINAGRFVDLIEVDAASRTKVEDTRELLDNVQYAPTRGRYKIYLIDEVHMLSGHSFNALLKTLEEPPTHVKFLLATTDPQRLPITILSRCSQFNLQNLSIEKIQQQLAAILSKENIAFDLPALTHLARAAQGSLRDALSLLDQAIAYGGGAINQTDVRTMLGTIEHRYIFELLEALQQQNTQQLLTQINVIAEQGLDFSNVLEELITALHHIAVAQIVPDALDHYFADTEKLLQLAQTWSTEDIQLYYQIALIGRRDLPLAPSPRIGFEMTLLRMLAFTLPETTSMPTQKTSEPLSTKSALAPQKITSPVQQNKSDINVTNINLSQQTQRTALPDNTSDWSQLLPRLNLSGFTQALATHCTVKSHVDGFFHLEIDPAQSALRNPKQEARLADALSAYFGKPIKLQITVGNPNLATPARGKQQQLSQQLETATQAIHSDNNVKTLMQTFNAKIDPHSIQSKNPVMLGADET